jgi:Ca2+-transporting ATPase
MTSPPRKQGDHIVNKKSMAEILFLGALMGSLAYINFAVFMRANGGAAVEISSAIYRQATTVSYFTIVLTQFINIMSRRYEFNTLLNKNFFSNKNMLYSLLISTGAVLLVTHTPGLNSLFGFASLSITNWLNIGLSGLVFLSVHEGIKFFKRKKLDV